MNLNCSSITYSYFEKIPLKPKKNPGQHKFHLHQPRYQQLVASDYQQSFCNRY